jgi:NADP-dependent 3-hydroxy acid dehydrogenase YdfG
MCMTESQTDTRLGGRRVLVTGASSGIGAATARAIVTAGGRVALLARRRELVEELAAELDGVAVPADVVDAEAARAAVDRAAHELGGLDGLVNAAGVLRPGMIADAAPSAWQLMFDVNVRGLLHVTQAAIPYLRRDGGDIVNLSSMSGRRVGSVEMAVYAASKAAVHTVSEGMRRELADDRVRVAVLAPGVVHTELFGDRDDETSARLRDKAETDGLRVDDVARAVVEVLGAPPHVVHVEVALLSIDQ